MYSGRERDGVCIVPTSFSKRGCLFRHVGKAASTYWHIVKGLYYRLTLKVGKQVLGEIRVIIARKEKLGSP